uniref:Phosphatidylinositol 3,4,5-trisphosphate 3-phosphatase and dual-specificity protein phosphatase PTEN n=1 Tax=Corethrella appendiculata TaxID=1370023 RepID=U5EGU8_9DIPT
MANSISNIKMTNPIKNLVSKQRKRYTKDGFNLDLTYIRENIIAMGFPAEKLEGVYRNHIDDVVRFLELKHKDNYKIYNLCSERSYDNNKFQRVASYPFEDHNPPNIELIQSFCEDVHKWLSADSKHVAAVHCKAGKGRTGTMICCYMLYSGQFTTAADALNSYGQQRTHDKKGVTIPSQRRYVEYFSLLLKNEKAYKPVTLCISEIKLCPPPTFLTNQQGTVNFSISDIKGQTLHCTPVPEFKRPHPDGYILVKLDRCIPISGDIKVEFSCKTMIRKEKFHFWFNTYFVNETAEVDGDRNLIYTLNKYEIDDVHKDKQHKLCPQDFKAVVMLQEVPSGKFSDNISRLNNHHLRHQHHNNHHQQQQQRHQNHHHNNSTIQTTTNNTSTPPSTINLKQHLNNHNHQNNVLLTNNQHHHLHNNYQHQQQQQQPISQNNLIITPTSETHTPSESSEASSSESSTEEDGWESGELQLQHNNLNSNNNNNFSNNIDDSKRTIINNHKLYYPNDDNYYYGSCIQSSNNNNNKNNNLCSSSSSRSSSNCCIINNNNNSDNKSLTNKNHEIEILENDKIIVTTMTSHLTKSIKFSNNSSSSSTSTFIQPSQSSSSNLTNSNESEKILLAFPLNSKPDTSQKQTNNDSPPPILCRIDKVNLIKQKSKPNLSATTTNVSTSISTSPSSTCNCTNLTKLKMKANSNVSSKHLKEHKLRWLKNMHSDPDLKEKLPKNVKIRKSSAIRIVNKNKLRNRLSCTAANSSVGSNSSSCFDEIDSKIPQIITPTATTTTTQITKPSPSDSNLLSFDYYSSVCDTQLSFGSPCKTPILTISPPPPERGQSPPTSSAQLQSTAATTTNNNKISQLLLTSNNKNTHDDEHVSTTTTAKNSETIIVVAKKSNQNEKLKIGFQPPPTAPQTTMITKKSECDNHINKNNLSDNNLNKFDNSKNEKTSDNNLSSTSTNNNNESLLSNRKSSLKSENSFCNRFLNHFNNHLKNTIKTSASTPAMPSNSSNTNNNNNNINESQLLSSSTLSLSAEKIITVSSLENKQLTKMHDKSDENDDVKSSLSSSLSNITPATAATSTSTSTNRYPTFSFREIRQELQSIIKSHNNNNSQQSNLKNN